jgi:hypothetical protein
LLSRDSGPTLATVSGDHVYYLVTQHTQTSTTSGMNVTVKRISLP